MLHSILNQTAAGKRDLYWVSKCQSLLLRGGGTDFYNGAYDMLRADDLRNAMSHEFKTRAKTAFGSDQSGNSRFLFHGLVASEVFRFDDRLQKAVQSYLEPHIGGCDDRILAVHARLFPDIRKEWHMTWMSSFPLVVANMVERLHWKNQRCLILFATNLHNMFKNFSASLSYTGCTILRSDFHSDFHREIQGGEYDHGPFESVEMVLADLLLLRRAIYFVGSQRSSFSVLIHNFVALNALKHNVYGAHSSYVAVEGDHFKIFEDISVQWIAACADAGSFQECNVSKSASWTV